MTNPLGNSSSAENLAAGVKPGNQPRNNRDKRQWLAVVPALIAAGALALATTGCETGNEAIYKDLAGFTTNQSVSFHHVETIILREGDAVKLTFPGAANLNATTTIQRDGNINLVFLGTVKAAGKTPAQLKQDVLKLYADKVESKELNVELVTDSFPVFVTGAVGRPGKVMSNQPMTVLQAVMEVGGPDFSRANLKSVRILRQENGLLKSYRVNLKKQLDGLEEQQFFLKPDDIVYVREKFNWF